MDTKNWVFIFVGGAVLWWAVAGRRKPSPVIGPAGPAGPAGLSQEDAVLLAQAREQAATKGPCPPGQRLQSTLSNPAGTCGFPPQQQGPIYGGVVGMDLPSGWNPAAPQGKQGERGHCPEGQLLWPTSRQRNAPLACHSDSVLPDPLKSQWLQATEQKKAAYKNRTMWDVIQ